MSASRAAQNTPVVVRCAHAAIEPAAAGFRVVIAGHSHKPAVVERDGVLFVNPGSAGPRRFSLPVTIGYLTVAAGDASAEIKRVL